MNATMEKPKPKTMDEVFRPIGYHQPRPGYPWYRIKFTENDPWRTPPVGLSEAEFDAWICAEHDKWIDEECTRG